MDAAEYEYEFIRVCGWCGQELERRPVALEPSGVSHGLCDECLRELIQSRLRLVRRAKGARETSPRALEE